ncbi:endolytic transglycosylase MltG [uncultured Oscillibacter sp.]|uniref:endolytic transglycosylase MltG n=1 Tax=uncultured Oscillibacter sp. TaxID=876091 RepID=UPI0025E66462|nr:endolytic transglycosylase MltG [uncultured Oscillibacter sp.]
MADFKNSDTASWDAGQVRREAPHPPRQRKRRRRRRRMHPLLFLLLHLIFVALASALLGCAGWLLFSDFCSFNRAGMPIEEMEVEVTAEDTVDTVADKLKNAGLIEYTWFFKLYANVTGAEEKIGMGTHTLNTDMDYHALVLGMRSAAGNMSKDTVQVTIPEGYTVARTIALLAKNGVNTEAALLEAAQTADFEYDFIDNESEDISRLEGYLFPDTYEFYVGEKPANALNRLIKNFNSKLDDELLAAAEARGYSLREIITIASLIERETDGTDQARIASVIYNRLDGPGNKAGTNGLLQVDAALLYGLPDHEGAITQADLEADTPYNLYKYPGLPPTPIANPGLTAIEAALQPEETGYYYYALGKDGKHHYFETYNEHLNFVNSGEYHGN